MERLRRLVQITAALAANPRLDNFFSGRLYQGPLKQVCVPFLNCYSCPGAVAACPLGSLQSLAAAPAGRLSLYVLGIMLAAGAAAGRIMCGWLCPFGLLQDLLDRPLPVRLPLPRPMTHVKFLLLPLAVILPALWVDAYGFGAPYFCQYICPAGTLTAGIPLVAAGPPELRLLVGPLFWSKVALLALILGAALVVYRPFCRGLCPLGAFWGLLNRWSLFRLTLDKEGCTGCRSCRPSCPVGLPLPGGLNSPECIRCLRCIKACPGSALRLGRGTSGT